MAFYCMMDVYMYHNYMYMYYIGLEPRPMILCTLKRSAEDNRLLYYDNNEYCAIFYEIVFMLSELCSK